MKTTALIMAGGRGERFWPRSRRALPKQFLPLTDAHKTMIQLTVERILPLVAMEDIYIATNADYRELVREQLPELPKANILCEPAGRNTAPCIGLGAIHIAHRYDDAVMFVLPSDHLIKQEQEFRNILLKAADKAQKGENLITIGITPNYPETGYGYIKYSPEQDEDDACPVECFVEKPCLELARKYLAAGQYLWNSGMFVWKISTILHSFREYLPDTCARLEIIKNSIGTKDEQAVLEREFPAMQSQSVDYGIMEKAKNIYTLPGNFGWDDVGSWLAAARLQRADENGNVITGNVTAIRTKNCMIQGNKKLLAAVGLQDMVVVDTEDATLICSRKHIGEIKELLDMLKKEQKEQYL